MASVDRLVFPDAPLEVVPVKVAGGFDVARFAQAQDGRKAYYEVPALGFREKVAEMKGPFVLQPSGEFFQCPARAVPRKTNIHIFMETAVHEVRHRVQCEKPDLRKFDPQNASSHQDALIRGLAEFANDLPELMNEPGFAEWIADPDEFDAFLIGQYVIHRWPDGCDRDTLREVILREV